MIPKNQTKCLGSSWKFCRYQENQIDTDLETEIKVGKIKDLEICQILFLILVHQSLYLLKD